MRRRYRKKTKKYQSKWSRLPSGTTKPCHLTSRKWAEIQKQRGLDSIKYILRFTWNDIRNRQLKAIREKRKWKQPGLSLVLQEEYEKNGGTKWR